MIDALSRRVSPVNPGASPRSVEALWLGSARSESRLVPEFADYLAERYGGALRLRFIEVPIRFSWRRPTPANWGYIARHILPIVCGVPFRRALGLLREFAPQALIASGGYVSAPALWAAQRLGVPYALLQLDGAVGLVNNHFAPGAWRVFCASAAAEGELTARIGRGKLRRCGYPVQPARRSRAEVMAQYGLDPARRLLIAMGGSLGSGEISRALAALLDRLAQDADPRWAELAVLAVGGERGIAAASGGSSSQSCGGALSRRTEVKSATEVAATGTPDSGSRTPDSRAGTASRHPCQLASTTYDPDGMGLMRAADFYLGRSGAATVGELAAVGIPALLIPDTQHSDRQQLFNARELESRGQARVLSGAEARGPALLDWLKAAWDQPRLAPDSVDAAEQVAADLLSLLEGRQ